MARRTPEFKYGNPKSYCGTMNKQDFEKVYNATNFFTYTTNEDRCHFGTAPTLTQCARDYGRATTINVMVQYLDLFFGFLSAQRTPSPSQRQTICWLTLQNYGDMKISEWLLFFTKAMAGQFGKFYNSVDTLDIMTAIRQWRAECVALRQRKREKEEEERQRERFNTAPVSDELRAELLEKMTETYNRLFHK